MPIEFPNANPDFDTTLHRGLTSAVASSNQFGLEG